MALDFTGAPEGTNVVSPELVLVDPLLREGARSRLPESDTLSRVDALVQTSRMASLARRSLEVPRGGASSAVEVAHRSSPIRRSRSVVLAAGGASGAVAIALLVGVRVDLKGTSAGADTAPVLNMPAPSVPKTADLSAEAQPKAGRRPPATESAPRRFVWAPAESASGYQVALFRGSSLVFSANTTRAEVLIPTTWSFAGKRRTLKPGEYRWYVWPVVSGLRKSEAIVRAKLVIPPF
jgi:hypothetical protein